MRKVLVAAALLAMSMAMVPSHAQATQTVDGTVMLPTRFTDLEGGFPGLARRVYIASMGNANGQVGYIIKLDPTTWKGTFTVGAVQDATGMADLDLFFYYDLGDDVYGETPPSSVAGSEGEFVTRAPGGESGVVPDEAAYAIVFMPTGANATFTYTANAPA